MCDTTFISADQTSETSLRLSILTGTGAAAMMIQFISIFIENVYNITLTVFDTVFKFAAMFFFFFDAA